MINDRVGPRLSPIRLRDLAEAPTVPLRTGSAAGAGVRGRGVVQRERRRARHLREQLRELPISLLQAHVDGRRDTEESASPVPTPRVCSTAEIP